MAGGLRCFDGKIKIKAEQPGIITNIVVHRLAQESYETAFLSFSSGLNSTGVTTVVNKLIMTRET